MRIGICALPGTTGGRTGVIPGPGVRPGGAACVSGMGICIADIADGGLNDCAAAFSDGIAKRVSRLRRNSPLRSDCCGGGAGCGCGIGTTGAPGGGCGPPLAGPQVEYCVLGSWERSGRKGVDASMSLGGRGSGLCVLPGRWW